MAHGIPSNNCSTRPCHKIHDLELVEPVEVCFNLGVPSRRDQDGGGSTALCNDDRLVRFGKFGDNLTGLALEIRNRHNSIHDLVSAPAPN